MNDDDDIHNFSGEFIEWFGWLFSCEDEYDNDLTDFPELSFWLLGKIFLNPSNRFIQNPKYVIHTNMEIYKLTTLKTCRCADSCIDAKAYFITSLIESTSVECLFNLRTSFSNQS